MNSDQYVDDLQVSSSSRVRLAFIKLVNKFFNLVKAIFVRLMMSFIIFLITWRAASVNGAPIYAFGYSFQTTEGVHYTDSNNVTHFSQLQQWPPYVQY